MKDWIENSDGRKRPVSCREILGTDNGGIRAHGARGEAERNGRDLDVHHLTLLCRLQVAVPQIARSLD